MLTSLVTRHRIQNLLILYQLSLNQSHFSLLVFDFLQYRIYFLFYKLGEVYFVVQQSVLGEVFVQLPIECHILNRCSNLFCDGKPLFWRNWTAQLNNSNSCHLLNQIVLLHFKP